MAYELLLQPRARKDFLALPPDIAKKIAQALHTLELEPRSSQSIKLSGGGGHRLRVGDYRLLYEIDDATSSATGSYRPFQPFGKSNGSHRKVTQRPHKTRRTD